MSFRYLYFVCMHLRIMPSILKNLIKNMQNLSINIKLMKIPNNNNNTIFKSIYTKLKL